MTTPSVDGLHTIRRIATTYKSMVLIVGVELLVGWGGGGMGSARGADRLAGPNPIAIAIALAAGIALAVLGYRLAELLGKSIPVAWAIGMFVPLVNLFALWRLSSSAQAYCRRHQVRVGFLGPDLRDVERLEREAGVPSARVVS
jgi:hypothetical protein